jgi:hypothetical protein
MRLTHRLAHRHVTVIVGVVGSAMLFIGSAVAAGAEAPRARVGDSHLSGPGVAISVTIPTGWHQISNPSHPQVLHMVYPDTCSEGLTCASGMAGLFSTQASSAQAAAQAAEQTVAGQPGIQGAAVTSEGPAQIAGRSGYRLRFNYSHPKAKFQAEIAAVETGPASAGMAPTSVILVTVSDLAGAPPASVIDQIIGSAQLAAQ